MNGTLNYGYISPLDSIDRDIKRVEDKADKAIGFETDIIRAQKDIECLSKQKYNGYSKCETDALLGGKVDKKDGFGLISNDCLHQICSNKDNISLLEQYIRELQEQNAYLKEELSNKVNISNPIWYKAELHDGVIAEDGVRFRKEVNTVFIEGWVSKAELFEPMFVLPAGFRPGWRKAIVASVSSAASGLNHHTARLSITTGGEVYFSRVSSEDYFEHNGASIDCCFTAEK